MEIKQLDYNTQFQNLYKLHLEFISWAWKNFKINYQIEITPFDDNYETKLQNRALHTSQEFGSISSSEGVFYLIWDEAKAVGMGGIKILEPMIAEVKRMYIKPVYRGRGLGAQLLNQLINDAKVLGFSHLRLDSMKFMNSAHDLYRSIGFKEIEPYSDRIPDQFEQYYLYMELQL